MLILEVVLAVAVLYFAVHLKMLYHMHKDLERRHRLLVKNHQLTRDALAKNSKYDTKLEANVL